MVVIAAIWIGSLFWTNAGGANNQEQVSYSLFVTQVTNGNVVSATIDNGNNSVDGVFRVAVRSGYHQVPERETFTTTIPAIGNETDAADAADTASDQGEQQ